jgi:hypothetical protein
VHCVYQTLSAQEPVHLLFFIHPHHYQAGSFLSTNFLSTNFRCRSNPYLPYRTLAVTSHDIELIIGGTFQYRYPNSTVLAIVYEFFKLFVVYHVTTARHHVAG